ncbi:MAG TPA: hypothetical protein VGN42_19050 [Pirellulales bacterium]|jgi:hypothetical protein|nr:hypothetical protein [Pirellulales bacterium]
MKKTILLLALVAGAGYYLHWYTFSTETSGNTEHVHINIDKDKIKQDEQRAIEKLRGAQGQVEGQIIDEARQRVSSQGGQNGNSTPISPYSPRPNQPAAQVVEQPGGYPPQSQYPPQNGYAPQGAYAPPQDPYAEPQSETPPARRQPARTAAQDLDRGFQ